MAGMSAAGSIQVQLEALQETIPLAVEKSDTFYAKIGEANNARKVSTKSFRIDNETALVPGGSMVNIDSASVALPAGGSSEFSGMTVTPRSFCVPLEWTKQAEMMTGSDVAIINVVAHQTGRATDRMRQLMDMLLQTDGTGKLATITNVSAADGAGNYTLTLAATPFGGNLLVKNQPVLCHNVATSRGSMTVLSVTKGLGGTHTAYVSLDGSFTGTPQINDIIRLDGVADTTPVSLFGIPYFHQTAATGTTLGVDRSVAANNWILATGCDAGGAQVTQPLMEVPIELIRQELGDEGLKSLVLHTAPAQIQAFKQMGYVMQTHPLADGKANGFDPFYKGALSVAGYPLLNNLHAAKDRIDYVNLAAWKKVKWGGGTFWYTADGVKVFPIYGSNGSPTAGMRSFLINCVQTYVDQFKSISSLTNLKVVANF